MHKIVVKEYIKEYFFFVLSCLNVLNISKDTVDWSSYLVIVCYV